MNLRLHPSLVHSNGLIPGKKNKCIQYIYRVKSFDLKPCSHSKTCLLGNYLYEIEDADTNDSIVYILFRTLHTNMGAHLLLAAHFQFFLSSCALIRCVTSTRLNPSRTFGHTFHRNIHIAVTHDCTELDNACANGCLDQEISNKYEHLMNS